MASELKQESPSKLLEFMMLVGKLKHVRRTGWVLRGIQDCESIAGHMYRMGLLALLLDRDGKQGLNRDKCVKIALVHDLAECIVGDITPWCGVSKEDKHRQEKDAMKQLSSLVDNDTAKELLQLYQEYEEQSTPEAKAVKDLDRFDMVLQAFEYERDKNPPHSLQGFFNSTEGQFTHPEVKEWLKELNRIRPTPIDASQNLESVSSEII